MEENFDIYVQDLSGLLKKLFEHSVESSNITIGSLNELLIDDLDVESIWEQIQCRNRPLRRFANKSISRLVTSSHQNSLQQLNAENEPEGTDSESDGALELGDEHSEDDAVNGGSDNDEEDEMEKWLDVVEEAEHRHKNKKIPEDKTGDKDSVDDQVGVSLTLPTPSRCHVIGCETGRRASRCLRRGLGVRCTRAVCI
jgi:hypothetical protein